MNNSLENLCLLSERIQAVKDVLGNNNEYAVAGLHIKRSTYKHPLFCKTDYCVVVDLLTGETILELQTAANTVELSLYQESRHHWQQFENVSKLNKDLGRSLQSLTFWQQKNPINVRTKNAGERARPWKVLGAAV